MEYVFAAIVALGLTYVEMRWHILRGHARPAWSDDQRAELSRQHARIGHGPGESWPASSMKLTPDEFLALLSRVPSGTGVDGYMAELRRTARG
jgi:hypothetical protein